MSTVSILRCPILWLSSGFSEHTQEVGNSLNGMRQDNSSFIGYLLACWLAPTWADPKDSLRTTKNPCHFHGLHKTQRRHQNRTWYIIAEVSLPGL